MPSVMVKPTDDTTLDDLEEQLGDEHDEVLILLDTTPGMSQAKIAEALGWVSKHGPDKAKVNNALSRLVKHRRAEKDERGKYQLTDKGKQLAKKLHKTA
jgi:predicted transcriptional regulator